MQELHHGNYMYLVLLWGVTSLAEPIAGPIDVVIERVDACPPEKLDFPFEFSVRAIRDRKHVRKWYYSMNITLSTTISDRHDLHMILASWSSRGGWKENAQILKSDKACTTTKKYFPQIYRTLMHLTTGSPDGNCPIPPGSYSIVDAPLTVDVTIPFFYGKWRVDSRIIDSKATKSPACVRSYSQTVPRGYGNNYASHRTNFSATSSSGHSSSSHNTTMKMVNVSGHDQNQARH